MIYLPTRKNFSKHTIKAYSTALSQLFNYVKEKQNVIYEKVTFEMLTADTLNAWLDSIESTRGCSIKTRNQRRQALAHF